MMLSKDMLKTLIEARPAGHNHSKSMPTDHAKEETQPDPTGLEDVEPFVPDRLEETSLYNKDVVRNWSIR